MERLTKRYELGAYKKDSTITNRDVYEKLAEYEDAEEQGLLLRLEHPNGWIPCGERLPSEKGNYIVCDNKGNVYSTTYYYNSWLVISATDEIIAWQPLPKPHVEAKKKLASMQKGE